MLTEPIGARAYWDDVADHVDRAGHLYGGDDTPYFRYKGAKARAVIDAMPVDGKTVLEVGSGPGANLKRFRESGRPVDIQGCDVSPRMADLARRTGATVTVTDGVRLPFPDGAFDVVFSVTVLQHNRDDDARQLLAEMRRVAREHVFLFEDIGDRGQLSSDYFLRPASFYQAADVQPIRVAASDLLHRVVHKLHRGHQEGAPFPRPLLALEAALLSVTRLADRVVPQRRGLAAIRVV